MRKFLCLFMASFLAVSLCACTDSGKADDTDKDDEKEAVADELEKLDDKDDGSEEDDDTDSVDDFVTTAPAIDYEEPLSGMFSDDENITVPNFSMGKVSGNTYTNDFLGISCTVPGDWTYYDEAQILKINSIAGSYMNDEIVEQLSQADIIYDMYVIDGAKGNSINVNLERLNSDVIENYTLKQIAESQIGMMETTFSNLGYSDVETTYQKVTVDGKSFDALKTVAEINGVDFYSVGVMFIQGDYMACITVGSLGSDKTDKFLSYFTFE